MDLLLKNEFFWVHANPLNKIYTDFLIIGSKLIKIENLRRFFDKREDASNFAQRMQEDGHRTRIRTDGI